MGQFKLVVKYEGDRTVNLATEDLSTAIVKGLELLGPDSGTIKVYEQVVSIGVPRVAKAKLVTEITSRTKQSVELEENHNKLVKLLDELDSQHFDRDWEKASDTYQKVGELLHKSQSLQYYQQLLCYLNGSSRSYDHYHPGNPKSR